MADLPGLRLGCARHGTPLSPLPDHPETGFCPVCWGEHAERDSRAEAPGPDDEHEGALS
ncbi:MAG: hypothetical protein KGZ61_06510 [Sandarakinorhabdus sp.]|nr:hypothetical protein [Sandarakinorhabdus sp.]